MLRWLDDKARPNIDPDFNVLDYGRTELYGHLLGVFAKLGVLSALDITPSTLLDFLIDVDTTYLNAPYHSFYHAVDIVTVLYYILTELEADQYLSNLDIAALLIAALCHDAGHVSRRMDHKECVCVCVRVYGWCRQKKKIGVGEERLVYLPERSRMR